MKKRIKCMVSCLLVVCLFQPCYQVLGAKTINQLQQEKNQYQQNKKNAQNALQQTQLWAWGLHQYMHREI